MPLTPRRSGARAMPSAGPFVGPSAVLAGAVAGAVALLALSSLASCTSTPSSRRAPSGLAGQRLEVVAVWSGAEQQRFERVLKGFEDQTGVVVTYTSAQHRVSDYLAGRMAGGNVPDVAFLPQPGLLRQYAKTSVIVPVGPAVTAAVRRNYGQVWQRLGSVDGRLYAVWFKAAEKSLIWYNVGAFERAGVVPPADIDGLLAVADTLARNGVAPFAVGGADGWTLTDWFENLYLRLAGPDRYDQLADHRLAWTDESVKQTLRLMQRVLAPGWLAGGVPGALQTSYDRSVVTAFTDPPGAAMVFEGDFVGGAITATTKAHLGTDADAFAFPAVGSGPPAVVGGGDAAVLLHDSAAGQALLAYLATPEAADRWAAAGGFVSPNRNLDLAVYPDRITRAIARHLLDAGDEFRFDLSDVQPAAFGGTADRGMRKLLQVFLATGDVDAVTTRLEAEATAAWSS